MFTFSLNRSIGVLGSYLIYRSLYQGYSYIRIGGKLFSSRSARDLDAIQLAKGKVLWAATGLSGGDGSRLVFSRD